MTRLSTTGRRRKTEMRRSAGRMKTTVSFFRSASLPGQVGPRLEAGPLFDFPY
jgi:hypothetical protein